MMYLYMVEMSMYEIVISSNTEVKFESRKSGRILVQGSFEVYPILPAKSSCNW